MSSINRRMCEIHRSGLIPTVGFRGVVFRVLGFRGSSLGLYGFVVSCLGLRGQDLES